MVKLPFQSSKKPADSDDKKTLKYSVYMQSRDSQWLNRNIQGSHSPVDHEPIEEDIRD